MEQTQELLQKWDDRVLRLRPRMEIAGEGLTLGAGTVFAKMTRDGRGARRLTLDDDEPRVECGTRMANGYLITTLWLKNLCRPADSDRRLTHSLEAA